MPIHHTQLNDIPANRITGLPQLSSVPRIVEDAYLAATLNTLNPLIKAPVNGSVVTVVVNGVEYSSNESTPAFTVNYATKALTWSASNAFPLAVGFKVKVRYHTIEA